MTLFNKKDKEEPSFTEKKDKTDSIETLGSRISFLRKNKGYTQDEFSSLLDVTPQAVSKWENDLSCPDIMLLPKIAELLDTTVDELLTGTKANYSKPDINISDLKLHIQVVQLNRKPININVPLTFVKRMAKIGNNISGIIGTQALNNKQLEQILQLVDEGVTGEVLNLVDENGQTVIIEIK